MVNRYTPISCPGSAAARIRPCAHGALEGDLAVLHHLDQLLGVEARVEVVRADEVLDGLGVLGKERYQYWRLMIWTLLRRPRMLPLAVTLAIYGYHYRRICELHILGAQ